MKLFKSKKSKQPFFPLVVNPFSSYHSNGTLEFTSLPDDIFDKGYAVLLSFQKDILNTINVENFNSDFKNSLEKTIHDTCVFEKHISITPLINDPEKKDFEDEFVSVKIITGKYYSDDRMSNTNRKTIIKTYATLKLQTKTSEKESHSGSGTIKIENNEIKLIGFNDSDGSLYLRIVSAIASEYASLKEEIKEKTNELNAKEDTYQMPEHFNKMVDIINNFSSEGETSYD